MKRRTTEILSILAIALFAGAALAQPPGGGQGPPEGRGRGAGRGGLDGGEPGEFRPMPLMMALDADRDGEISAEEIKNAVAALKKLDKNKDGKLAQDELRPEGGRGLGGPGQGGRFGGPGMGGPGGPDGGPGAGGMAQRLMSHDANKDGKVDKDELPEQMQRILERGDLNKDGAIDKEEAEKVAEQFGQAGGRGGRGGQAGGGQGGRGGQAGGGQGGRGRGGAQDGGRPQRPE